MGMAKEKEKGGLISALQVAENEEISFFFTLPYWGSS